MSRDVDPLVPPHSADELLASVLARGHALRSQARRRRIAGALGPPILVVALVASVVAGVRGGQHHDPQVAAGVGRTTTTAGSRTTAGTTPHAGTLAPVDLPPGSTVPGERPTSTTAASPTSIPGSRTAPVAVFDVKGSDGRYRTAVLRPGAAAPVAITAATAERQWPVLSPDGRWVAFSSTQSNLVEGLRSVFELFVVSVDGSGLRQITQSPLDGGQGSRWPSWSPDGSRLVASCANNSATPDICTLRPDGTDKRVIGAGSNHFTMPRWSPDGRSVVVLQQAAAGKATAWILDPIGKVAPRQAAPSSVVPDSTTPTTYSTDGTRLLFVQPLPGAGSGQPVAVDLATGRITKLAALPPGGSLVPCGAQQVLYRTDEAYGPAQPGDLILVGLDGTSPTVLLRKDVAANLTPSGCASH